MRTILVALLTLSAAAVEPAPLPADGWLREFKIGAFATATTGYHSEISNDPSIASTTDQIGYQAAGDGRLAYTEGPYNAEHRLMLRFGRIRQADASWTDSVDEIDYDGVFRRFLRSPHFFYAAIGGDTVFTSPEPYEDAFDPVVGKASAGYGQRWHRFIPRSDTDLLEARIGVRAQRRWGRRLADEEEEVEVGPEAWLRYDAAVKEFWTFFLQYEAFSEFEDLGHVSHLATSGIDVQLAKYLTLRLAARAYYEQRPEDADRTDPRYDDLSARQETLIGLTYLF